MRKHVALSNKNHEVESPKSVLEAIENEVEKYLQMN